MKNKRFTDELQISAIMLVIVACVISLWNVWFAFPMSIIANLLFYLSIQTAY